MRSGSHARVQLGRPHRAASEHDPRVLLLFLPELPAWSLAHTQRLWMLHWMHWMSNVGHCSNHGVKYTWAQKFSLAQIFLFLLLKEKEKEKRRKLDD
jgi:hypothetical protein